MRVPAPLAALLLLLVPLALAEASSDARGDASVELTYGANVWLPAATLGVVAPTEPPVVIDVTQCRVPSVDAVAAEATHVAEGLRISVEVDDAAAAPACIGGAPALERPTAWATSVLLHAPGGGAPDDPQAAVVMVRSADGRAFDRLQIGPCAMPLSGRVAGDVASVVVPLSGEAACPSGSPVAYDLEGRSLMATALVDSFGDVSLPPGGTYRTHDVVRTFSICAAC